MRESEENSHITSSADHVEAMEFSPEEHRYAPVEILRSMRSAAMIKVLYVVQDSSMASPSSSKSEVPLQVLIVNTDEFDCVYELTKEYTLARRCLHKNLVAAHVSFTAAKPPGLGLGDKPGQRLWVVMPLVSRVSLKSMMISSSEFRDGLPEPVIAFVIGEILAGLNCIHSVAGNVHGNVSAGCIYMDDESTVKLAFRSLTCEEITAAPRECETAPEMTEPRQTSYGKAADIWGFGMLILELVFGKTPVYTHDGLQLFIKNVIVPKPRKCVDSRKLQGGRNPAGSGGVESISDQLREIIRECLFKDPKKRPTAKELLEHDYFKLSRETGSYDNDVKKVLVQLQKHAVI